MMNLHHSGLQKNRCASFLPNPFQRQRDAFRTRHMGAQICGAETQKSAEVFQNNKTTTTQKPTNSPKKENAPAFWNKFPPTKKSS